MPTETIPEALVGERLDRVVSLIADVSRSLASEWIRDGLVEVNGVVSEARSLRLSLGDEVGVPQAEADPDTELRPDASVEFVEVYADRHLAVIDKPEGLVVHPGNGPEVATLAHGLLHRYPEVHGVGEALRPGVVHRLDKGTSGLLVIARTAQAYEALVDAMAQRRIRRVYRTLVWGHVGDERGVVDAPIGRSGRDRTRMTVSSDGRDARTHYQRLATFDEPDALTLLECRLETGRTHQIRVHMEAIGHPVVGDAKYHGARGRLAMQRPFLHAFQLEFAHPVTGEHLSFESALPDDLESVLAGLG